MLKLKFHQEIVVKYMETYRALVLFHSTGSGKTLAALFAMYKNPYPIIIIGPKSSRSAFEDNIRKANLDNSRVSFYTYSKLKMIIKEDLSFFSEKSVIIDEAHTLRNDNIHNLYITSALIAAQKILLLTATPIINYINDLAVLVNIVKGSDILPTDRILFDQMFYNSDKMELINVEILKSKLRDSISYYYMDSDQNYPTYKTKYIEVVMSYEQLQEYIYHINKIIFDTVNLIDNDNVFNINYEDLPKKKKNMFLNVTRQLSNAAKNEESSPKINKILKKIKKGPYPIIIYSNFLSSGVYKIAILLEKLEISYGIITGMTSIEKLPIIINNYNNGVYKILLVTSAGSESLDLKNTRQIHIMEPHWNEAKIDQVIGRAIRYESHNKLKKEERNVDIYRWISIFPKHIMNLSADQYLINISRKKTELQNRYMEIIKSISIENNL